jgi:hypothetical protein
MGVINIFVEKQQKLVKNACGPINADCTIKNNNYIDLSKTVKI